jgi:hypothetical protein
MFGGVTNPGVAQVVDSLLPIEEALRRFRANVAEGPVALSGGASTRDGLVRRFVTAIERRDTASLAPLLLSKAEFAFLLYPESEYTRPPYRQQPSIVWLQMVNTSAKGIGRILDRDAGRSLGYEGYRCDEKPLIRGKNRIWRNCVIKSRVDGSVKHRRLFGSILERGGRFKFVTYSSEY